MIFRRRARLVACFWLLCQVGGSAAAPFAVCRDHDHAAGPNAHVCHAGATPGEMCPMHRRGGHAAHHARHAPPAQDAPTLRCVCRVSDAALAALLLGQGIIPAGFVLPFEPLSDVVAPFEWAPSAYTSPTDTPPPRA
jgi:hypothetical protein